MQTFFPYDNYQQSIECLDKRRLGKQRVEARQILQTINKIKTHQLVKGWRNHPTIDMWFDYEDYLKQYYNHTLLVWARYGYQNIKLQPIIVSENVEQPWWLGQEMLHNSHRSNLLRKAIEDPKLTSWYAQFAWDVLPSKGYIWPTRQHTLELKGKGYFKVNE
ncbi:MAG: pyrimidine dimer DNA glycosylase/endonuclease V [Nitrosarchaeum sp.]|nr:pyrimidine dimer DNA glycosylase/endonuclease V [Nitrosarchaeum sp.]